MITVGVEEEYLLVDPATAVPTPLVEEVRRTAGLGALTEQGEVQDELLQAQIEVATPVCSKLEEIGGHLLRLRHALASAAEANGCRIAATGAAPVRGALPVPVTRSARYLRIEGAARQLVDEQLICGMHVHVAIPDAETGVAVLNRIRVWLPTLLAMSANSPLWDGRDTGYASWRTIVFSRWPVSGPPPYFEGLADYERRLEALLGCGVIADRGQVYWQARLSGRYPTVEVRCPDVQLRPDEAVMLAGIVRALVTTAIAEEKAGIPPAPASDPEVLQAATWHAARYGLNGTLVAPDGRPRSSGDVLCTLMRHITPALEDAGDLREVSALSHRLLREGTPADRQRRAVADGGLPALTGLITGTVPSG
ncbi:MULTISPECIES: glutamate--cysteine ligase [unclassified Streptomyces]|uniref:carboxylate-amine ligase n=1 Tax=unclassified Streptomyces TaxID=2593676 RepID=UPI000DC7A8A8|nr:MULTISPECIES: glutamate--cysteine ligase [unclassified Streptomyces]AWZ08444.1 carboxylate--amine ligase [Streptomyces sp. ICC4]AWZ13869.1 carboxylate--amine ligase [Streptomyces sp. ICC1]